MKGHGECMIVISTIGKYDIVQRRGKVCVKLQALHSGQQLQTK